MKPSSKLSIKDHKALMSLVKCAHCALHGIISTTKNSPQFYSLAIDLDIEVEQLKSLLQSVASHNYGKEGRSIYDDGDESISF